MAKRGRILDKMSQGEVIDDSCQSDCWKILKYIEEKSKFSHDLVYLDQKSSCNISTDEVQKECYSVLPPLDSYFKIDKASALSHDMKLFEAGDIIYARIASIHEHGLSAILLALSFGKSRDLEKHNLRVWLSESEIPKDNNHEDVLLRYSRGDILCCTVIKVNIEDQELIVSLLRQKGTSADASLGIIEDGNLPVPYKKQVVSYDSYEHMLCNSVGFANPNNVEYLMSKLGIPEKSSISLTKTLHGIRYSKHDFAEYLRRKQSKNIAEKIVKEGVEKFKLHNFLEALQDFNRALDMDTENVNAMVARGALYANRESFSRAIHDFEGALKLQPNNKNAKKYLVEVLIERAKKIEAHMDDVPQVKEVEKLYLQALQLDNDCAEAKQALGKIKDKKLLAARNDTTSSPQCSPESVKFAATANKLRKILRQETKHAQTVPKSSMKHDKKNAVESRKGAPSLETDSDTSSTSSSSSGESSPHRKIRSSSSPKESRLKEKSYKKVREKASSERNTSVPKVQYSDEKLHCKSLNFYDHEPYMSNKSSNSISKRRRSDTFTNYRAAIRSDGIAPLEKRRNYERSYSELRKSRASDVPGKNKRNCVEPKVDITTNLKKITKDNIHDILKEIGKFEHSNKSTG